MGVLALHHCCSRNLPPQRVETQRDRKQPVTSPPVEGISRFFKYNFMRLFHVIMCLDSPWGTLEVLRNVEAYWPNSLENGRVVVKNWGKGKTYGNF